MMSIANRKQKTKGTTEIGFVNPNRQKVVRATGMAGSDHKQKLYELVCGECGESYLANGSDIHDRLCPECQGGRPGTAPMAREEMSQGETPWTVADAKARFSEMIEKAVANGPQIITRNGKRTAVVVSAEEWDRKTKPKGTLAEFFLNSPLRGADLDLERLKDEPRDIEF